MGSVIDSCDLRVLWAVSSGDSITNRAITNRAAPWLRRPLRFVVASHSGAEPEARCACGNRGVCLDTGLASIIPKPNS